jgi:predicted O-methyltransferase YrrM
MSSASDILEVIDKLDELRRSRDDAWQIPRIEGELLHHIAVVSGARLIVEIGTSYGFSGLFWAMALTKTGGKLHTIDNDPRKHELSRQAFERAGVGDIVVSHLGDAKQVLVEVPGPIDLAFIDADKPSTRDYFDLIWPKSRVGGSVIVDNATTHRAELADFVRYVRSRPDATSAEVPVGNGIEWTIKHK